MRMTAFRARPTAKAPDDEGWGRGRRPSINVSVYDALNFAKWLSRRTGAHYRLPTEVEWEHAARAGGDTTYPWGNELDRNKANCDGCGSRWDDDRTAPVGSFPPNDWGLYDVAGNVGEWTCSMRDPEPINLSCAATASTRPAAGLPQWRLERWAGERRDIVPGLERCDAEVRRRWIPSGKGVRGVQGRFPSSSPKANCPRNNTMRGV